jgi:RNA polymerase sigma factor (sigma-70 family)
MAATANGTSAQSRPVLALEQSKMDCDRDLLLRFSRDLDQAAFTVVVQRHAGLVLGVCRRVLRHHQDAEDVCQATFLALARKAGSGNWHLSVAPWLYRVAYHLALRVRRTALRQRTVTGQPDCAYEYDPLAVVSGRELRGVLDEELTRLPNSCRTALLLCYLEGLTRDEAAALLGWSLGKLKHRLEQGRALLGQRLGRRGFTLPAVLAAGLSVTQVVREGFAQSTIHAAMAGLDGASGVVVPARVAELCTAALRDASLVHLKVVAAVVLALCATAAGIGVALKSAPSAPVVGDDRLLAIRKIVDHPDYLTRDPRITWRDVTSPAPARRCLTIQDAAAPNGWRELTWKDVETAAPEEGDGKAPELPTEWSSDGSWTLDQVRQQLALVEIGKL